MAVIIPDWIWLNIGEEIVVHAWIYPMSDSRHILGPTVPAFGTQLHWGYTGTRRWYTIEGTDHFFVRVKCELAKIPLPVPTPTHTGFHIVYADL